LLEVKYCGVFINFSEFLFFLFSGYVWYTKAYDTSESSLQKSLAQVTFAIKLAQVTFTTAP